MKPGRKIFINEDDAHFTVYHPREDMTQEGLERLIDYYAKGTQVGGILFCINLQKALYDSKVWEPVYRGYDPDGGPDQPFLKLLKPELREINSHCHARNWIHNIWLLHEKRKIDRFQIWIDRCRHHGIEGWLTMRMNDAHGLQEYRQRIEENTGSYDSWAILCPSERWKQHPEWRRAAYREECSFESAFDFSREEVRQHHLALAEEALGRWDMDGFELDWLRWAMFFKPGGEKEGLEILTGFTRKVRELVTAAEKRAGHKIMLGARIPCEPRAAFDLGYDVPRWAREGLLDQVTLSNMSGTAYFDFPLDEWRLLLGDKLRILTHCSNYLSPYSRFGALLSDREYEGHNGSAASALNRGSDGLYLFNDCYLESRNPEMLNSLLRRLGSLKTLQKFPRRHAVAPSNANAPGSPSNDLLPIPLTNPAKGNDFSRFEQNISIKLCTGPVPRKNDKVVLYLGFSPDTPELVSSAFPVYLNTIPLRPYSGTGVSMIESNRLNRFKKKIRQMISRELHFAIPPEIMKDDVNLIEIVPPEISGELRWAEIKIIPENSSEK